MGLGHRVLKSGVGLGCLPLQLLVAVSPSRLDGRHVVGFGLHHGIVCLSIGWLRVIHGFLTDGLGGLLGCALGCAGIDWRGRNGRCAQLGVGRRQVGRTAFWRIGFAVVGAIERQGHLGFGQGGRIGWHVKACPQSCKVQRIARTEERSESLLKAEQPVLALAIQIDGAVWLLAQNTAYKARQHRPGAHLHKDAGSSLVHGLDLLNKTNRLGNGACKGVPQRIGFAPVGCGFLVGVDDQTRRRDLLGCEGLAKRLGGAGDNARMEGRCHRQALGRDAGFGAVLFHLLYSVHSSRKDHLPGGIVIGHGHITTNNLQQRAHLIDGRRKSRHRAGPGSRLGHQFAPLPCDAQHGRLVKGAGSVQSCHFAVTMPPHHVRLEPQGPQQAQLRQRSQTNRRLCIFGTQQARSRRLLGIGSERRLRVDDLLQAQGGTGIPRLQRFFMAEQEITTHGKVLAALPRKEHRKLASGFAKGIFNAFGAGKGFAFGYLVQGVANLVAQVGIVLGNNGQPVLAER